MTKKWLRVGILIMSLIYIFFIPEEPLFIKIPFKLIPMILILIYAYPMHVERMTRYQLLVLVGLFFCMMGDGLLIWFVVGLSAFLIGHIFYIAAFLNVWSFSWLRMASIVPIAVYSVWIGRELVFSLANQGEDALILPVIFYITVISLMSWSAFMTGNPKAMIGGVLFVISDSVLSWDKFIGGISLSGILIMLTYYTAQFFIASSIRQEMLPPSFRSGKMNETVI